MSEIATVSNITLGEAFGYLLAMAAALVTLSKAWDLIAARIKPNKDLRAKVEEHDRMLANGSAQFSEIKKSLEEQNESINFLLHMDVAMINHIIDGNSTEPMKKTRDAVMQYFADRR